MISADEREAQATACLEAAALHKPQLLAVAVRLAGGEEAGGDLFQQTVLQCHDAIQVRGFAGGRYEFYLLAALKNNARRPKNAHTLAVDMQALADVDETGEHRPWATGLNQQDAHALQQRLSQGISEESATARAYLAEQVEAEIQQHFNAADRLTFRLHLLGHGCQDIAELIGKQDRSWVHRRLERMKDHLRTTFRQAWDSLGE